MVTYALDASAVIRYLDGEAGTDRVEDILRQYQSGEAHALISAMHWGEVTGILWKRHGAPGAGVHLADLRALQLAITPVTAECAERGARIKAGCGLPYVDALAVELAEATSESVVITADFDFKAAEHLVSIEFLPPKPTARPIS